MDAAAAVCVGVGSSETALLLTSYAAAYVEACQSLLSLQGRPLCVDAGTDRVSSYVLYQNQESNEVDHVALFSRVDFGVSFAASQTCNYAPFLFVTEFKTVASLVEKKTAQLTVPAVTSLITLRNICGNDAESRRFCMPCVFVSSNDLICCVVDVDPPSTVLEPSYANSVRCVVRRFEYTQRNFSMVMTNTLSYIIEFLEKEKGPIGEWMRNTRMNSQLKIPRRLRVNFYTSKQTTKAPTNDEPTEETTNDEPTEETFQASEHIRAAETSLLLSSGLRDVKSAAMKMLFVGFDSPPLPPLRHYTAFLNGEKVIVKSCSQKEANIFSHAQSAATDHDCFVVPIIKKLQCNARTLVVMPMIDTLKEWGYLQTRSKPFSECMHILLGLAEAMRYLHCRGIFHGDIKPDNMGLYKGRVVLFDFGCSELNAEWMPTLHGRRGTKMFLAPEMETRGSFGLFADIFSAGMTMAHFLEVTVCEEHEMRQLDSLISSMLSPTPTDRPNDNEIIRILSGMTQTPLSASIDAAQMSAITQTSY